MRTILSVDHKNRIIQPVKVQRFNESKNLIKISEYEAFETLQDSGRFTRYARKYQVLK